MGYDDPDEVMRSLGLEGGGSGEDASFQQPVTHPTDHPYDDPDEVMRSLALGGGGPQEDASFQLPATHPADQPYDDPDVVLQSLHPASQLPVLGGVGEAGADPTAVAGPYATTPVNDAFVGEDDPTNPTNVWRNQPVGRRSTAYLDDDERQGYGISFGADGTAYRDGEAIDTTAAGIAGAHGSKAGREIFTMDDQGSFYSADPNAEARARGERFHHTSLAGYDEDDAGNTKARSVAGAGEMQMRDGTVEVVSDRSGHYMPDMEVTEQVIDSLEDHGVAIEAVGVELGAKPAKPGMGTSVSASAVEVQAYADVPDSELGELSHEQLLRQRHADKGAMLDELRQATRYRRDAADAGVAAEDYYPQDQLEYGADGYAVVSPPAAPEQ